MVETLTEKNLSLEEELRSLKENVADLVRQFKNLSILLFKQLNLSYYSCNVHVCPL